MAKKQQTNDKKSIDPPQTAEMITIASENITDLAKKLSDVAEKMKARGIWSIESNGWKNLGLAIEKLGGAIGSVERAYRKASIEPVERKLAEENSAENHNK